LPLDPRIGMFTLDNDQTIFRNSESTLALNNVPVREVDFATDEKAAKLFPYFSKEQRNLYTPADLSAFKLKGTFSDREKFAARISFVPCSQRADCFDYETIQQFLRSAPFILFTAHNFVDMEYGECRTGGRLPQASNQNIIHRLRE